MKWVRADKISLTGVLDGRPAPPDLALLKSDVAHQALGFHVRLLQLHSCARAGFYLLGERFRLASKRNKAAVRSLACGRCREVRNWSKWPLW